MVSNKFYLLLDLNQWLPPYESNTLTAELSRSFIFTKKTKWDSSPRWIINIILLRSNTNLSNTDQRAMILDHAIVILRILILTRNYLHDKICIISTKGYSSVGRAPRLHARQCFSGESIMQSKELILLRNRCLTP
jgi:hypothetical protein